MKDMLYICVRDLKGEESKIALRFGEGLSETFKYSRYQAVTVDQFVFEMIPLADDENLQSPHVFTKYKKSEFYYMYGQISFSKDILIKKESYYPVAYAVKEDGKIVINLKSIFKLKTYRYVARNIKRKMKESTNSKLEGAPALSPSTTEKENEKTKDKELKEALAFLVKDRWFIVKKPIGFLVGSVIMTEDEVIKFYKKKKKQVGDDKKISMKTA